MNKKLRESSSASQTSGTGRYSMFESHVTPFFASARDDKYDTQGQQKNQDIFKGQKPANTQEYIERLVQQNQNSMFHNDDMSNEEFGLGFSFAGELNSGENAHFSYDHNSFDQPFQYMGSFHEQQSPRFFDSNTSGGSFPGLFAENYGNGQNFTNQSLQQSFTQTVTNDKKSTFYEMFSFQNNDLPQISSVQMTLNQPKRRSLVEEFAEDKKEIIYQVDSRFECEGQTSIMQNPSQSISQQNKSVSHKQQQQPPLQNRSSEYELLRQSIIKEISQMGSDQWEERKDDFVDQGKKQKNSSIMSNKKISESIVRTINESRSQQKRNNFNQSIINRLLIQSDINEANISNKNNADNNKQIPNNKNMLRTSRSMMTFRIRNQNKEQNKKQPQIQKHQTNNNKKKFNLNDNSTHINEQSFNIKHNSYEMYESQVEQITNEKLQMYKYLQKASMNKNPTKSYQKQQKNHNNQHKMQIENQNNHQVRNILNKQDQKNNNNKNSQQKQQQISVSKNHPQNKISQNTQHNLKENQQIIQSNEIKRRRPIFQFKPRNRFPIKNDIIDQRQQFEPQEKQDSLIRNEFMSQNIEPQTDILTKPIELYQSAAKSNQYGRSAKNKRFNQQQLQQRRSSDDFRETSKKSFYNLTHNDDENKNDKKSNINLGVVEKKQPILPLNKMNNQVHNAKVSSTEQLLTKPSTKDEQPVRQKRFNIFKRRTIQQSTSNDKNLVEKKQHNQHQQTQKTTNQKPSLPQKPLVRNKFQFNFNRKSKQQQNNQQDKLQKSSVTSSKQSLSSDGIKIDTKGFMDKILNNVEKDKNNKNQYKINTEKQKPALNFKRINRFSSIFAKQSKQKHQQHQFKSAQKQQNLQQINQENHLTRTPRQQVSQILSKHDKSPSILNLQQKSASNKFQHTIISPNNNSMNNNFDNEQLKERMSQRMSYKSQQNQQIQKTSSFLLPKFTFSKRTPPKQTIKSPHQSKSKSVTFDTVKRVENEHDDIEDNFSFDSNIPQQQSISIMNYNNKQTLVKKRENNLMGVSSKENNNNNNKFSSQNNGQKSGQQRRNAAASSSSTFLSISSRSRKSAEMMRSMLEVLQQTQKVKQMLLKAKRQREEQYRRICFLNNLAKEKFPDETLKRMAMSWEQFETELQKEAEEYERKQNN